MEKKHLWEVWISRPNRNIRKRRPLYNQEDDFAMLQAAVKIGNEPDLVLYLKKSENEQIRIKNKDHLRGMYLYYTI